jgi:hypothetical protein
VEVLPALMRDCRGRRESGFIQPLRLGVGKSAYALLKTKSNACK